MLYKRLIVFYVVMVIGTSIAGLLATTKEELAFLLGLPIILSVILLGFIIKKWRA